jgi:hypothetical protein
MKAVATLGATLLLAACSAGSTAGGTSTPSASPIPSPLAGPSGRLNAEVPMPAGFPADMPIYPKSRLTSGAAFVSSGEASWGMEWETLDSTSKVQSFYASKLAQGDWVIAMKSSSATAFTATFQRKSTSAVTGTLAANNTDGVTRILMSLVSASG